MPWMITRECEYSDGSNVGQVIWRSEASGLKVHGQFGTAGVPPWDPKPGYVVYGNIAISQSGPLSVTLRYSKYSSATVPIMIYVDDESTPRASFYPVDQGSWDQFAWSDPIPLGIVTSGVHSIKFFTAGQQYGVADLDEFVLAVQAPTIVGPTAILTPTLAAAQ